MSRVSKRIENFNRAFVLYSTMRDEYISSNTDSTRLALTQSFEIVVELGWKVLKDYLFEKAIEVDTPVDAVKAAFGANVIQDGQIWIDMVKDRNASSHEYNSDKIEKIIVKIANIYYDELCKFKKWLENINDLI